MAADPSSRTRPPVTTQQLIDFVLDPRDPGYEAAAQRRGGRVVRHWYDQPAVAVGCLIIGFLLAIAWVHTHRSAPEAAKVQASLVSRVRAAERNSAELAAEEAKLTSQLSSVQKAALPGSPALLRSLNRSQLLAGQVATGGPGLQVRLSEPKAAAQPSGVPGPGDRTPASGGHILIDRDVRSVVNELWFDGAEAVSVNGIRLTPTSAIRFAGDAVLVDFEPISSPYVIDAIGDADQLATGFAASDVASRYQTLASAKGIGFSFAEKAKLTLAASPGITPRYARVAVRPR